MVYNNEQLSLAQQSGLGVTLGPVTVSDIGQADDVALISNDLHSLQCLLDLSLFYCQKYHITLSRGKTKLQAFSNKISEFEAHFAQSCCNLYIQGDMIKFVDYQFGN